MPVQIDRWFKFALNKNRLVFINMDMIPVIEFTISTVTIGEFELSGEDGERFRREFDRYNNQKADLVRVYDET
jgi:hypothetical protein